MLTDNETAPDHYVGSFHGRASDKKGSHHLYYGKRM